MGDLAQKLLERYSKAKSGTDKFYSMYKRGYELSSPNYNNVDKGNFEGYTGQPQVYDSTVCRAADAFVNTFVQTIFPPQTRWMSLEPSDNLITKYAQSNSMNPEDARSILQPVYEEITSKFFDALNQSNFYSIVDQFAHDVFLGTGVLNVQRCEDVFESASPLDFSAIPPLDISIELAPSQKITGVFRKQSVKYSQIKYVWQNFDYSKLQNKPTNSQEDPEFEMVECCVLDPVFEMVEGNRIMRFRWHYFVICQNKICLEQRLLNNPFIIFLWSLRHGENVGRGLLTKLLPDADELQQMVRLKKQWLQMHALGVYTASASMLVNPAMTKIRPNGVIMVKEQGAIQPLQPAGNPQVQQMQIQELQQAIKETALDFTIPTDPRMTATQVSYIAQRQLQLFSGVVGRIQFQLLFPIVQNSMEILSQAGLLQLDPKLWNAIGKISPFTTQMKILSPIGRVQYRDDLNAFVNSVATLGQIDPSLVSMYVNLDELPEWIFKQNGAPTKLLREKKEVDALKQQQQQMQMIAFQQQAQEQQKRK